MAVHNQAQTIRATKGGVVAGLVAGLVSMTLLAVMNAAQGRDVWQGLKFASVPFLGERALAPGFDHVAVVTGVASHLAISIGWGVLFGLVFFGLSKGATLLAGLFWGIVVWLGMLYVALPLLGFPAGGRSPMPVAIFTHEVFALALALVFLPFQREFAPLPPHRMRHLH